MVELIFSILGVIVLLGVVWGALCMVTGEKNIGNTIMVNCFTAMVLFIILLSLFNLHGAGNGSLNEAVPMLDGLERYGNTSNFLKSNPAEFALNFVQLVTISLLVNYISNLFGNGSSNNIVGKLIGRIVIVMLAFIAYGFVWKMISENVVIKWCIYAVESLITVGAVSYPIMVLAASITGLDCSMNLEAVDEMAEKFPDVQIIFIESGGDNLSATFSPDLADASIYVIDVAQGEKIPRKGGPGVTRSDLLVINKTDLAPLVGADLDVMASDSQRMRQGRKFLFSNLMSMEGVDKIIDWIKKDVLFEGME